MSTVSRPTYRTLAQLLANVESLRGRVAMIEASDPQLGEKWKVGMLRHWGERLIEATERARSYAVDMGLDPDEAVAPGG